MTYNIHPLFVHFPIAFLLLYSLLVILPFERWFPKVSWRPLRFVILLAGVLGAFAASTTGEIAEHLARPEHRLVETHSFFAAFATWVYGLVLAGEVVYIINRYLGRFIKIRAVAQLLAFIERVLCNRIFVVILALVGIFAISITGLLGGVMVYGVSADPLAPFVLKMLGL